MLTEYATIAAAETAGLTTGDVCIVGGRPMYCMPPCQADADPIWVPWSYRDALPKAVYKGGTAYDASPNDDWSWVLGTGTPAEAGSATTLSGDTIYANWTAEDIDRPALVVADVTVTAGSSTSALLTLEGCSYSIGTLLSNGAAGDLTLDTFELADYAQGTTRAKIQLELDPDADVCELRLYQTQALIGSAALSIASGSSNNRISAAADTSTVVLTGHPALVVYQRPYVAAWYDTCDEAEVALSPDAGDYCYIGADRVLCRWVPGSVVAPAVAGVVEGSELITDGDMEAASAAAWTAYGVSMSKSSTYAHGGSLSLRSLANSTTRGAYQATCTPGKTYRVRGWCYTSIAGKYGVVRQSDFTAIWTGTANGVWQEFDETVVATGTHILLSASASLTTTYYDDVSIKEVVTITEGSGLWLPQQYYDDLVLHGSYHAGRAYNAAPNSDYSWTDVGSRGVVGTDETTWDSSSVNYTLQLENTGLTTPASDVILMYMRAKMSSAGTSDNDISVLYYNGAYRLRWTYTCDGVEQKIGWDVRTTDTTYPADTYVEVLMWYDPNTGIKNLMHYQTMAVISTAGSLTADTSPTDDLYIYSAGVSTTLGVYGYPAIALLSA